MISSDSRLVAVFILDSNPSIPFRHRSLSYRVADSYYRVIVRNTFIHAE